MKSTTDLVQGLIRKADSDLTNSALCLSSSVALDTACFHAQQAAEKLIKAYLIAFGISFPLIHNLEKLIEICAQHDPTFQQIKILGQELTSYAVQLRYDEEFWPTSQTTAEAVDASRAIRAFILSRLPAATQQV